MWEALCKLIKTSAVVRPREGRVAALPKPLPTREGRAQGQFLVSPPPASGPAHGEEDEWEPLLPYSCQSQGGCRRGLWG